MIDRFEVLAKNEGRTDATYPGLYFYRASRPTSFVKRHCFGVTLTAVVQGSKVARYREREIVYDADNFLLVTGEMEFEAAVIDASPERPYLAIGLEIPADVVLDTLRSMERLSAGGSLALPAPLPSGEPYLALIGSLKDIVARIVGHTNDPVSKELILPLVIQELVIRLMQTQAAAALVGAIRTSPDSRRIQDAMAFIQQNLSKPLSVELIAASVSMSSSHFAHRFRHIARVSPMMYQKQLRLMEARKGLLKGDLRVNEAARQVGYESVPQFHRDFKSYFGSTPNEYVRRKFSRIEQ